MIYKTISDNETTVVLTPTPKGWKAVATCPNKEYANAYIAHMNTLDATRELQRPLALLLNGDHVDLPAIAEQLLECRRVILREVAALGKAEATDKKEEAA